MADNTCHNTCCNIKCISSYRIGFAHIQHVVLFKDGSEITVDRYAQLWLSLIWVWRFAIITLLAVEIGVVYECVEITSIGG